jgi:hypothetical protein
MGVSLEDMQRMLDNPDTYNNPPAPPGGGNSGVSLNDFQSEEDKKAKDDELERLGLPVRIGDRLSAGLSAFPDKPKAEEPFDYFFKTVPKGIFEAGKELAVNNIAAPFNQGMIDLLSIPNDISNMLFGTEYDPVQNLADKAGIGTGGEQQPTGYIARGSYILGSSVIPFLGLAAKGMQAAGQLRNVAVGARTVWQQFLASQGANVGAAASGEVMASYGAGVGGEYASQFTDDPTILALAEFAGGLTPTATHMIGAGTAVGRGLSYLREDVRRIADMMIVEPSASAMSRYRRQASDLLRSQVPDPQAAANRIGDVPELTPAQQTGDPRLIAIENKLVEDNAKLATRTQERVDAARARAVQEGRTIEGADARATQNRFRALVGSSYRRLQARSRVAAERAFKALANLNPDASPSEITTTAYQNLAIAEAGARADEVAIWKQIPRSNFGTTEEATSTFQRILAERESSADPADIPKFLREHLLPKADQELADGIDPALAEMVKDGTADLTLRRQTADVRMMGGENIVLGQGVDSPQGLEEQSLGWMVTLYGRIRKSIRDELGGKSPNRNSVRIMAQVADALLADMTVAGGGGDEVKAALDFSLQLNNKFTRGRVGQLLGYEADGGLAVDPELFLTRLMRGDTSTVAMKQFLEASPESAPVMEDWLKKQYILGVATVESGGTDAIDPRKAERIISQWEEKGYFKIFPHLRSELENVTSLAQASSRYDLRVTNFSRLAYNSNKSTASLYFHGDLKGVANDILTARNPEAVARRHTQRLGDDIDARRGLQSTLLEEILNVSAASFNDAGEIIYSPGKLNNMIKTYLPALRATGMEREQIDRVRNIAEVFIRTKARGGTLPPDILKTQASSILEVIARWAGSHAGSFVAKGSGSQLVMAQAGSQRARKALAAITRDHVREVLVAAIDDPELYKSLLVGFDKAENIPEQKQALNYVLRWLTGVQMDVATPDNQEE